MTINYLKELYFQDFIAYGNALSSKDTYDGFLIKFIEYLESINITNPKMISAKEVKDYIRNVQKINSSEPLSNSTRHLMQSSIKSFLRYLYQNDYIDIELGSKLERIKIQKKESAYLSKEQYSQFISVIKKTTPYYRNRDLALMNLLIKSGIRRAEIVNLNISDIDLQQARIWIKRKGGNEGYIPLLDELVKDLEVYLKTLSRSADQPLFMSKRGQRLSASSVWHLVKKYALKAGLSKKLTVHSLRHGFATKLNDSGVPIPIIQKLMGHRSSSTTYRYLHVTDINVREEFNNKVSFDERG